MFAELLQSGRVDSDEKRRQYLHIILSESERLSALIENVLDFARVERGKAGYTFETGSLGEVVARATEVCRMRAERDQVELLLAVEPALPPVRLDERAVEIAVINLVDNALKYAKDSGRIELSVARKGRSLQVAVTDHGAGIPAEDRKIIFDRFVRGRGTKQIRGSGIGLALVKHVAVAHGGDAWVEPVDPHGSRFVFSVQVGKRPLDIGSPARRGESAA
jgi:two-component system phosphate regulon sensor histidine kinase PhoR